MNKKAAIIEFGTSHSECLYSLYRFLNESGYDVSLILNEKLKVSAVLFKDKCPVHFYSFQGKRMTIKSYVAVRRLLSREGFERVIFLTAGGVALRNFLMLPLPRRIKTAGILHNTDKLSGSITGKFIFKRLDKFFVLADYMLEFLPPAYNKRAQSIYTIFYPEYPLDHTIIRKNENEFLIGIPGTVEYGRRDYEGLISELKNKPLNENVKFILLGPGNNRDSNLNDLLKLIKNEGMESRFRYFADYISDKDFYSLLQCCDVLLPLIHPDKEPYSRYIKYKISGTYNLSAGFKIPMLCHSSLEKIEDFKASSFFYDYGGLCELINKLSSDKAGFLKAKSGLFQIKKWEFEYQRKKFIDFLESNEK